MATTFMKIARSNYYKLLLYFEYFKVFLQIFRVDSEFGLANPMVTFLNSSMITKKIMIPICPHFKAIH